jgi:hypothetical protein
VISAIIFSQLAELEVAFAQLNQELFCSQHVVELEFKILHLRGTASSPQIHTELQLISVRKRGAEMVLDLQSRQALHDIRQAHSAFLIAISLSNMATSSCSWASSNRDSCELRAVKFLDIGESAMGGEKLCLL